jgi:hypothetical protein
MSGFGQIGGSGVAAVATAENGNLHGGIPVGKKGSKGVSALRHMRRPHIHYFSYLYLSTIWKPPAVAASEGRRHGDGPSS